jgi:mono/diheme cytochrome c family protein
VSLDQKATTLEVKNIDMQAAKRGKKLYQKNCLSCHGPKGLGDGPESKNQSPRPVNLITTVKSVPNFNLYMMVSKWQNKMPGWKKVITQDEMNDVKNYILSLAK